jgi:hypothetical protein
MMDFNTRMRGLFDTAVLMNQISDEPIDLIIPTCPDCQNAPQSVQDAVADLSAWLAIYQDCINYIAWLEREVLRA